MANTGFVEGIGLYFVLLFSCTLHEAAHAWAALRGGDTTAYRGGQVSLDPRPHIRREPFGLVVLPLLSVVATGWPLGYASAPYDPAWAYRHPQRSAWMALAGPAANLLVAIIAFAIMAFGRKIGVFFTPESINFGKIVAAPGALLGAAWLISACFSMNLVLAILNLIPLPPLDGSGAIPLFLGKDKAQKYLEFLWEHPEIGWVGMILAWQLCSAIYPSIWESVVSLLYPNMFRVPGWSGGD